MTKIATTMDEQVAALAQAGICVRPGTQREDLRRSWPEAEWEAHPFHRLFDLLEHTDDADELAVKCIEYEDDWNAYARIADALVKLAKGRLPLETVESRVDFKAQSAFLSFTLDEKSHRIEFEWQEEYADMRVFSELSRLLSARSEGHAFYILSPDPFEEGVIVVCLDNVQLASLRNAGAEVAAIS